MASPSPRIAGEKEGGGARLLISKGEKKKRRGFYTGRVEGWGGVFSSTGMHLAWGTGPPSPKSG